MKLQIIMAIFLTSMLYSQKVKLLEASQNVEITKDSLDSFIEKKMIKSGMVGLAAAIIVNKKTVWIKGYGYADKENNISFTPTTIINLGSIMEYCSTKSLNLKL